MHIGISCYNLYACPFVTAAAAAITKLDNVINTFLLYIYYYAPKYNTHIYMHSAGETVILYTRYYNNIIIIHILYG